MKDRIKGPAGGMPDPAFNAIEDREELTLRPRFLSEFVGQEKLKENLAVYIEAAKQRGEHLDHVFLSGPPGPHPRRPLKNRETWLPFLPASENATFFSSTRYTVCGRSWRKCCTRRWKTSRSTW